MARLFIPLISFLFFSLTSIAQTVKPAPNINIEIYDSSYAFESLAATYTTVSILPNVGIQPRHAGAFGAFNLSNGQPLFRHIIEDKLGGSAGGLSAAQAFNINYDGTASVFTLGSDLDGHYLLDDNFNTLLNLNDLGIYPDPHGITKLSTGEYAYFQDTTTTVNFNSAVIPDTTQWDALGHNIVLFDPSDSSSNKIFDWHTIISPSMVVPAYLYEGDQGPDAIDWGHPNSIFEDYDGHILLSWRHLGVCKINKNTGDVIWWAGLPDSLATINGFNELECISGDCRMRLQHDLKPIKGKPGFYSLFDNGDSLRPASRALFFKVDEQNNTIEVTYESFFAPSDFMGSVDVLDNGSYLVNVCSTDELPSDTVINSWINNGVFTDSLGTYLHLLGSDLFLFDSTHTLVAKYYSDSANYIYNSFFYRYSNWPEVICRDNFVKSNTSNLDSLKWFSSDNTFITENDSIEADSNSYYFTFSKGVTTAFSKNRINATPCVLVNSIEEPAYKGTHEIYPNPVQSQLNLSETATEFEIISTVGMKIKQGYNQRVIDVSELAPGIYFINIPSGKKSTTLKFIKS